MNITIARSDRVVVPEGSQELGVNRLMYSIVTVLMS